MNRDIKIIGHRGYRAKFPENTLLSFAKAFEYGADGIECDVQKTSDGIYVIFHDLNLSRITGNNSDINGITYEKLKKLDAGKGEHIPDLSIFLESMPAGKLLNIELKEETLTEQDCAFIHEKIKEAGYDGDILISSFKHSLLPFFKMNGYKTGMLFETDDLAAGIFSMIIKTAGLRPDFLNLPVTVFDVISPFKAALLRMILSIIAVFGIRAIFWTVNTAQQYDSVKGFAYAAITDNVPEMLKLRGPQFR